MGAESLLYRGEEGLCFFICDLSFAAVVIRIQMRNVSIGAKGQTSRYQEREKISLNLT